MNHHGDFVDFQIEQPAGFDDFERQRHARLAEALAANDADERLAILSHAADQQALNLIERQRAADVAVRRALPVFPRRLNGIVQGLVQRASAGAARAHDLRL